MMNLQGKRALAICEKPDLARKIGAVAKKYKDKIPYEVTFVSQSGHLLQMLKPDEMNEELKEWSWETLPITEQSLGGWKYRISPERKAPKQANGFKFPTPQERYDLIKEEINSGKYDFIIHIGDPDREGQLLVDLVLEKIGNTLPVMRYWENALTEDKILPMLLNLKSNDEPFYKNTSKAGKARQHADYLVGMNVSRAASLKMNGRVSAGRVRTTLFNFVYRRELEIRNFKPETTFGVKANYVENFSGFLTNPSNSNITKLDEEDNQEELDTGRIWFKTEGEAQEFINSMSKAGVVSKKETKRTEEYGKKFYKLSTAQKDAEIQFGYNAKKTKSIIQTLYEQGFLTYTRTSTEYLDSSENLDLILNSVKAVPGLNSYLEQVTPENISRVKNSKKWVNDAEVKKTSHSALVPTSEAPDYEKLTQEQKNIYSMVAKRYLAAFLPPLVSDKVTLEVVVDGDKTFVSRGKTIISKGWKEIYSGDKDIKDVILPDVNEGDKVTVDNFELTQKTTQCPKRYTSGDLIDICEKPSKYLVDDKIKEEIEKLKLGTPATLDAIIDGIVKIDKYATWEKEGKRIVMTPNEGGMTIYDNYTDIGFSLLNVDTTGRWEIMLEQIVSGELTQEEFEKQIDEAIIKMVDEIKNSNMKEVPQTGGKNAVSKCHKCGGDIYQTDKAFYCSGYKENGCMVGGFRNVGGHLLTPSEFKKLQSGEELVVDAVFEKKDEKGKVVSRQKYKQRVGLNSNGTIERIKAVAHDSGYQCPACGKKILENDNAYACEGRVDGSCHVYVSKVTAEVELQKEDFDALFSGNETRVIKGFVAAPKEGDKKKEKRTYDAHLYIDKNERKLARKFPIIDSGYVCPVCQKMLEKSGAFLVCTGRREGSCKFRVFSQMYKQDIKPEKMRKMLDQARSGEISGCEEAFLTEKPIETNFKCPYCATNMLRDSMKILCPSCKFEFYRQIVDELMTDEDIENLLTSGKTDVKTGLISKAGPCSAQNILNYDAKKIETKYIQNEVVTKYKCPICESSIIQQGSVHHCENSSCGFKMWLTQGHIKLKENELDDLYSKYVTSERTMKKKNGDPFKAKVAIDFENKGAKFIWQ